MISICIPVYNVDVSKLVESLRAQAERINAEIILIDDGSQEKYKEPNRAQEGGVIKYHELSENIGRARIRNRFTEHAANNYLLFLDCDTLIISEEFIQDYKNAMIEFPEDVICGGSIYQSESPGRKRRLHWKYGIIKESQPAVTRNQNPMRSFMTGNFLVPLQVLRGNPFNERLSGYGHEDSLFGYELSLKGKKIIHIDNPVTHAGIELNRDFLSKTAEAVQSLVYITELLDNDPDFIDFITLLKTAKKLESSGMAGIIRCGSIIFNPLSKWMLSQGIASLTLLNAYKLSLYLQLKHKPPQNLPAG